MWLVRTTSDQSFVAVLTCAFQFKPDCTSCTITHMKKKNTYRWKSLNQRDQSNTCNVNPGYTVRWQSDEVIHVGITGLFKSGQFVMWKKSGCEIWVDRYILYHPEASGPGYWKSNIAPYEWILENLYRPQCEDLIVEYPFTLGPNPSLSIYTGSGCLGCN